MSDEWGYNIEEYQLITGEISNRKRLIVEGKTDKRFFKVLLDEFLRTSNNYSKIDIEDIDIDDIETFLTNNNDLKSYISGAVRNRKKIEYVHENVKNSPRYDNLIFFLDREFDNFIISYTQEIKDEINEHKVDGALILSRGHSIENYLFEFNIIRQPLIAFSETELFSNAIRIFEKNFDLIICLASAVSIALKECEKIQALETIIDWELIDVKPSNISLRIDDWKKRICERKQLAIYQAEEIIITYEKWYAKIKNENVDVSILRWLCHGHIGIHIIVEVYYSCLIYCDCDKKIKHKIRRSKKEDIYESFANWWADKAVRNECLYPTEVLEKLGLINHNTNDYYNNFDKKC